MHDIPCELAQGPRNLTANTTTKLGRHVAAMRQTLLLGALSCTVACPDLPRFQRWMEEFVKRCGVPSEDSCDWITCDCLLVSLQVPVNLSSVPICFENGLESFSIEQRNVTSQMLRGSACGTRTRELGEPCGQCDGTRMERPECSNTTAPPHVIFVSDAWRGTRMVWGWMLVAVKILL